MTTVEKLRQSVENANTATLEGRQQVAVACKELYHLIEEKAEDAGITWMLCGMYNDLCKGNFAEPYMCEMKKNDFRVSAKIYQDRIGK